MKHFFISLYIFIILTSIVFNSCSSPMDVNANRKITESGGNGSGSGFETLDLNTSELIFYDVPYQGSNTKFFILHNNSDAQVKIDNIKLLHYPDLFKIYNPAQFPIFIRPHASDTIFISFRALGIGEYVDTLTFNNSNTPNLKLHAIVPSVDVFNLNFGTVGVNKSLAKPLYIQNNGSQAALIKNFVLIDPDGVFKTLSLTPIEVAPGETKYFIIQFTPNDSKPFNAKISFEIEGSGFIDNIAELSGYGIKQ